MTALDALRGGAFLGASEVRLSGCGLQDFPPEIFDLAETLEVLDLSGNSLTKLPGDIGRLTKLRALFCSNNPFERLPAPLGDCAALSQIGFRGCGLRDVPGEALPPLLRWLTLTDNEIAVLPAALGERPLLQKLMLAGNKLDSLPTTLQDAPSLELLRLSANRFEALPPFVTDLPRLAWLAWAGNPMDVKARALPQAMVSWSDLETGSLLGEGASGRIYEAHWRPGGRTAATPVALKIFKNTMTSDGLPACEIAASLAAGSHPNLVSGTGRMTGHPEGADGLLMPLQDRGWRVLAQPPSLKSCSRDVYDAGFRLTLETALRIASGIAAAGAHLHARGVMHGDLYAHNVLWDGTKGDAVLSDFGAASVIPPGRPDVFEPLEVLAWGHLLGELLDRCEPLVPEDAPSRLVHRACVDPKPGARPMLADALDALKA